MIAEFVLAAALVGQCSSGSCGVGYGYSYGYAYRPTYTLPAYTYPTYTYPAYGYCTYQPPAQACSTVPYTWYSYAPTATVPAVETRYQTGGPSLPSPQTQPKSTP